LRSALFWEILQSIEVIPYRRFGTTYRYHLQGARFLYLGDGDKVFERENGTRDLA